MQNDIRTRIEEYLDNTLKKRLNYKSPITKKKFIRTMADDLFEIYKEKHIAEPHKNHITKLGKNKKGKKNFAVATEKTTMDADRFVNKDIKKSNLDSVISNITLMLQHGRTKSQVRNMLSQFSDSEVEHILSAASDQAKYKE